MFESTYDKKLNKNKNKNPILAHGPWRVFGPSRTVATGPHEGCLSGLYGTWSYQFSPDLSVSPLSKTFFNIPMDSAEKGSAPEFKIHVATH